MPRRLDALTAFRYPAAVFVVFLHVVPHFVSNQAVRGVTQYGYLGVTFFFMLSGFVLTWAGRPNSRWKFWFRRIARIVPITIFFSIIAFAFMAHWEFIPDPWGIVQNYLLLQAWNPHPTVYFAGNGVTWSLSCELFFYLLFPFIIGPIYRLRARGLAILASLTIAGLAIPPIVAMHAHVADWLVNWAFYIFPPYRFGEFLLGVLLARSIQLGFRIPSLGIVATTISSLAIVLLWLTTASSGRPIAPFVSLMFIPGFALILMVGAVRFGSGRGIPRPLVYLGEWSFALYVIHQMLYRVTLGNIFDQHNGISGFVGLFLYLALTTVLAGVCCYVVERPCMRVLNRLVRRPRAIPAASAA